MNYPDRPPQARLTGRAREGGAPAPVAVRLLRPSVALGLLRTPAYLRLLSRSAASPTHR